MFTLSAFIHCRVEQRQKNRYGYYFCPKRCAAGSSVPVKQVEDTTADLLAKVSLRPETVKLINAFLRQTYYLRIGALRKKREQADVELKKLQELRQKLIEKNLSGVYSDEIFKEQNKLLEDKIKGVQTAKSDAVIEKYNLEAITDFIQQKYRSQQYVHHFSVKTKKGLTVFDISARTELGLSGLFEHPN